MNIEHEISFERLRTRTPIEDDRNCFKNVQLWTAYSQKYKNVDETVSYVYQD